MLVSVLHRNTMENKKMHGIDSGKGWKEELSGKRKEINKKEKTYNG